VSVYSWVRRAEKAAARAEAVRCLREAEAVADDGKDWVDIAEAWSPLDATEALRCIDTALAQRGREEMTYPDAARILAKLGDVARARELLERCPEFLGSESAWGWKRLAYFYVTVFDDRDGARRVLERGLATIKATIDNLATFADAYIELGDRETADAIFTRAEASAGPDDWFPIFQLHLKRGDEARAWQLVERTLAGATTADRCLRIALHTQRERPELMHVALAKAEQLAPTAREWIRLAVDHFDYTADETAIRRCLEAAVVAVPAAEAREHDWLRSSIAQVYRLRLGDDAAADRIWPRGVSPDALLVSQRTLAGWQPERARLLDWLRPQLTMKQMSNIAAADYGHNLQVHLAALLEIQKTGLIPQPLMWFPREVLELRRWSEGPDTDHLQRAFACTVLCLDASSIESSAAPLVDSCLVLGLEALAGAVGLLVAICESLDDYRTELGMARLGLLVAAAARDPADARLPALCSRILEDNTRPFGQREKMWHRLIDEVLAPIPHLAPVAARLHAE